VCSTWRGTALGTTKLPEATAEEVSHHLGEGWSVRAMARLVKLAKETVARLLRVTGRHAERCHDQHGHDLAPKALECDELWGFVKNSSNTTNT
jgi:hypothetical protein